MATKEKANMSGEDYLHGRRAGVEGTHGKARKGGAEKTAVADKMDQSLSGSVQTDLTAAAKSLYSRAMGPGEDPSKMGDQAIRQR